MAYPCYKCRCALLSFLWLFAAKNLDRHYLLSGDSDGIIILWELSTLNNNVKSPQSQYHLSFASVSVCIISGRKYVFCLVLQQWRNILQLSLSHKKGVTCITAYMVSETDAMFASASSDGRVNVWDVTFPSQSSGKLSFSM